MVFFLLHFNFCCGCRGHDTAHAPVVHRSGTSGTGGQLAFHGISKPSQQLDENIALFGVPIRENRLAHALTCRIDAIGHRLALGRDDGLARSSVHRTFPPFHQTQAFQFGDLAADGGVVAA